MHTTALVLTACTATFLASKEKYPEAVLFALIFILMSNSHNHCNARPVGVASAPVIIDTSQAGTGAILPKDANETDVQYGALVDVSGQPIITDEQQSSIDSSGNQKVIPAPKIVSESSGLQLLSKGLYDRQFTATSLQKLKKTVHSNLDTSGSADAYTAKAGAQRTDFFKNLLKDGPLHSREDELLELQFLMSDASDDA